MSIESTSVCSIILAYGARTEQLRKVLTGVFAQNVGYVIVVANDVHEDTLQALMLLKNSCIKNLEIVQSSENIGSAGGYALGLSIAINKSYEYFWLLDDDNLPQEDALAALLAAYSIHQQKIRKEKLILQSFRESLPEMQDIVYRRCLPSLPKPASFIGFHIFNLWNIFCAMFSTKNHKVGIVADNEKDVIRLHWAPYGGLFFRKDAVNLLGFPNPLFFLYADDLAYTLHFTSQGGNIILVPGSRITDLEPVWNATNGTISNIYRRLKTLSSAKTYYEVRNRVYIGRTMFPGHSLMYSLNKLIYISFLGFLALYYRRGDRFKLILRAAREGEQGLLGKRNFED